VADLPLTDGRPLLPLIPSARTYSFPKEAEKAPTVRYSSLDAILTKAWTTDVHTTAYSVERHPYRLSRDAVTCDGGVMMVLFVADVDGAGHLASDDWWVSELAKLDILRQDFPGAFIYRTRGGYRIVYLLATPIILRSLGDAEAWKVTYLAWVAALKERFGIEADPACQDWQRLYRVPHATRSGGRPEARETLGSPYQIGPWACEPTDYEQKTAKTLAKRPLKQATRKHQHQVATSISDRKGVLYYAFKARNWLGDAIDTEKWAVKCPWDDRHTKGTAFNTSTVLFVPGAGDAFGWLHCSHAHCQQRDIRDVMRLFSEAELKRAKTDAGVIETTTPRRMHKLPRMQAPWFGQRVPSTGRAR
jgi:hypothetical protein